MTRVRPFAAAAVVVATLAVGGCAQPSAPTPWQETVRTVAQQASAGDYGSALTTLSSLEAEVTARRDAGELGADEAERILSRLGTVRADLASLGPTLGATPSADPTPSANPTPSAEPTPSADPAPSAEPTPTADPTPSGDDDDRGKDDKPPKDDTAPGNDKGGPGKKG